MDETPTPNLLELQEFREKRSKKRDGEMGMARAFLESLGRVDGETLIRFWQGAFFKYDNGAYRLVPKADMQALVSNFVVNFPETKSGAGARNDVLADLSGITLVPHTAQIFTWLDKPRDGCFVACKNGIISVEGVISGDESPLIPLSPKFFATSCLPFAYDASAQCPIWLKTLEEIQPDADARDLLQEWFGYHLTPDVSHHKMIIFEGEGANGKSVVSMMLREVLGAGNCTSILLEQFSPSRLFPLAQTIGKLANICDELGAMAKDGEGLLKQFVAGSPIEVDRKGRDYFTIVPTAKLTWATNALPRFVDRSDGIWRRTIVLPFTVKFDEEQRDRRLISPKFWHAAGELPGVLNWAFAGLRRLHERGRFTEARMSSEAKEQHKLDCNPAKAFLVENYATKEGARYPSHHLYAHYRQWAIDNGYGPLGSRAFSVEVHRVFPVACQEKNPTYHDFGVSGAQRVRCRAWRNLCLNTDIQRHDTNDT